MQRGMLTNGENYVVYLLALTPDLPPPGAHHSMRRRPHVDRVLTVWTLHRGHSSD